MKNVDFGHAWSWLPCGGSWALLHGDNGHAQAAAAPAAPEVSVAQALTRKVGDRADFTGKLQAVDSAQVHPRVSGFIESVRFREGALVHKGQCCSRSTRGPYQAEVDRLQGATKHRPGRE